MILEDKKFAVNKFELSYDTISYDYTLKMNKSISSIKEILENNSGKRILSWIEKVLEKLAEELNYQPILLDIHGVDEYEKDIISAIKIKEISLTFYNVFTEDKKEKEYQSIDNRLAQLANSNHEVIKRAYDPHNRNLNKFLQSEVNIPVVATMSAGKSSLINAILGKDLLPSGNQATTATTCEIKINNDLKTFKGTIYKDCEPHESVEENIESLICNWNAQGNDSQNINIELEGPSSNIESNKNKILFIDSPGPNNSQNTYHREATFNYLKDDIRLPIILYVINYTQIGINDDKFTLEEICKVVQKKKESLERILFIVNKIDELDTEKETLQDVLYRINNYLKGFGIENPKLFFVSSKYALDVQKDTNNFNANQLKKHSLHLELFRFKLSDDTNDSQLKLIDYVSLNENQKQRLIDRLNNKSLNKDIYYSGLASVLIYIEDYIHNHHDNENYHNLNKSLKSIIDTLSGDVAELDRAITELNENSRQELIKKGQEKIKEFVLLRISLLKIIDQVRKDANNLKDKYIKQLHEKNKYIVDLQVIFDACRDYLNKYKVSEHDLDNWLEKLKNQFISSKTDIVSYCKGLKSDLSKDIKDVTNSKLSFLPNEIAVKNLMNHIKNQINGIAFNDTNDINFSLSISHKKREYVLWFLPFWTKEVIDGEKNYEKEIHPILEKVEKFITEIINTLQMEVEAVINDFINKCEEVIKTVIDEEEKMSQDAIRELENQSNFELESRIKDFQNQIFYIQNFIK